MSDINKSSEMVDFVIQASSRTWAGGRDSCMNTVNGLPVVAWTLKRILESFPASKVVIAAPGFDQTGSLSSLAKEINPSIGENDCFSRYLRINTTYLPG
jgi:hypothetical protein